MADDVDDDDGLICDRTTEDIGLPALLREEYHKDILPRTTEVAATASRQRRYASQLLNLFLQVDGNTLPAMSKMQTFLDQAQALFAENSRPRAGESRIKQFFDFNRSRSDAGI